MKQAVKTIIIVMVAYCAIAFIKADYNALKWTQDQRLFFVLLLVLIHILDYVERETDEMDE